MKRWLSGGIIGGGVGIILSVISGIFILLLNFREIQNPLLIGIQEILLFPLKFLGRSMSALYIFYVLLGFAMGVLIGYARSQHNNPIFC
jgi:hypothetical protein